MSNIEDYFRGCMYPIVWWMIIKLVHMGFQVGLMWFRLVILLSPFRRLQEPISMLFRELWLLTRTSSLPSSSSVDLGAHGGRVVTLSPPTSEAGGSTPGTASSGKAGSCLPSVGSLQYRTLANCMYWFPLPFQLPVVIWPVQCWKQRKTPNK